MHGWIYHLELNIENNNIYIYIIDVKQIVWGIFIARSFLLLHSCLPIDRECLWFSIRKILFSSLFTRPLLTPSNSDDEQMISFRIYNSRLNSTPINNNEIHRSTIFTTLNSERCFHAKRIYLSWLYIHHLFFRLYFITYSISQSYSCLFLSCI